MIFTMILACSGGADPVEGPPPVCNPGSAWQEGTDAFRDATSDWGLDALGVTGIRLNAVDFDGDGWVDLAVRTGDGADDGDVRNAWLLRNTGSGSFEDVTERSGIRQTRDASDPRGRPGGTWIWADVDNDGDLDVYTGTATSDTETSELLLNRGDGTFELTKPGNPVRDPSAVYAATFSDVDRDGHIDLFVGNYYEQDRLLLGDGTGGFTERTKAWGLATEDWVSIDDLNAAHGHSGAWATAACDLNDDGWPELLASSYGRAPNQLWQHDGVDRFDNRSVESGYAFDPRTDWTDNESARCWCKLHPTDDDCAGVPGPARILCDSDDDAFRWNHANDREPYRLGGNSGQTVCAELDGDGAMDLVTTEIVHWDVGVSSDPSEILHNTGEADARFERPGNDATGLTRPHEGDTYDDGDITADVFDFDNDGRPDIYIGSTDYPDTRGLLWRQTAPMVFERVPKGVGIDQPRSHGSVAADFDHDGDLDVVVGHSTARCDEDCYSPAHPRLFENLSEGSNYVQLELIGGPNTNRAAIGARVDVLAGDLQQTQEVGGGGGQLGDQTDLVLHFGLGAACEADITVRWPDAAGTTETFHVGGGYRWRIEQGEAPEALIP